MSEGPQANQEPPKAPPPATEKQEVHPVTEQVLSTLGIKEKFWLWCKEEIAEARKAPVAIGILIAIALYIGQKIPAHFLRSEIESYRDRAERSDRDFRSQGVLNQQLRHELGRYNRELSGIASEGALREAFKNPLKSVEIMSGDISNRLTRMERLHSPDEFALYIDGVEVTNVVKMNEQLTPPQVRTFEIEDRKFVITVKNKGPLPIQNLEVRFSSYFLDETNVVVKGGAWRHTGTTGLTLGDERREAPAWRTTLTGLLGVHDTFRTDPIEISTNISHPKLAKNPFSIFVQVDSTKSEGRHFLAQLRFK